MASPLSIARTDLTTRLSGFSIDVLDAVPEKIVPPIAFVGPGSPYVEGNFQGMMFGESKVNLTLTLVVAADGNAERATALDDLIVEAVDFINSQNDLFIDDVDRPAAVTLNGQRYLGCLVNLSRIVRLSD